MGWECGLRARESSERWRLSGTMSETTNRCGGQHGTGWSEATEQAHTMGSNRAAVITY
jgi:hypothetical protein